MTGAVCGRTPRQMKKALQRWPFETVQLALGPTIPHHCSNEFLIACRDLARDYDVGLHSHVAESKVQVVAGYERYGMSLAAHFGDGVLRGADLAAGMVGAIVKDPLQDRVAMLEYLETVVKERDGWKDLYRACRDVME